MTRQRLSVAMLALAAAACSRSDAMPTAPPPPEVGVLTVERRTLPLSYEFVGEVQPIKRVEVRARVDGVIEARPFTEGSMVKAGQVLYRLERVRYDAAFRSASARMANARRTLERLEPLLERNAVAQQDVDNARTEVEAAEAVYEDARKNREDAVVRAEIGGRVGRTRLEVGARVTGPADLLTTVEQVDPVYVSFHPSSQDQQQWRQDPRSRKLIQPGSSLVVRVVLPDGTELPRQGKLDYVSPSVDPATGTQELRASFGNDDLALVSGQFVRVRLQGFERDSALAVPRRAVQQSLDQQFVLVVGKGDTVQARDVDTGTWSGDWWIVEGGLEPGDRIVVDGVQKAAPGSPVRPVALADSAVARGDSALADTAEGGTR
ncbi:MAG: efflux RND transporter periplasmic adaptor subunit [Gemmatimonadales bacterium]|nr:efflux RND transporter periplasmic adaptor subunit [Gemmatimonadales bacterium]